MNELAIGSVLLGAYRIEHVFTGGGMGVVYRARHLVWDIDLAIKHPRAKFLQSAEQRRDFVNECETWSSLGLHPYLATCFYTREIGDVPCVVAEFAEGGALNDWIASRRIYAGEDAAINSKDVIDVDSLIELISSKSPGRPSNKMQFRKSNRRSNEYTSEKKRTCS